MKKVFFILFWILGIPALSFASATPVLNSGDTAWMLTSSALVMLMTPAGLALFYGGMGRSKNILNTIGLSLIAYAVVSVVWMLWGFSFAFGPDIDGIIGSTKYLFLGGVSGSSIFPGTTIPVFVEAAFQMTFAAITVALASGSVVERVKFSSWIWFSLLWVTFIYAPIAHWVWGGGWLSKLGALDFAGGTVVHINAGVAGLVFALMLGKRKGYGSQAMPPASITLTILGAALLWFGWFGFNAGSAGAANGLAGSAWVATNTAAAIGALSWMYCEWIVNKHPTMLGAASGAVAGLVAITPASGFVNLEGALVIGLISGIVGFLGAGAIKRFFKYDDSLDAFGVHALNGIWGALATGIFADPLINAAGKGALYGNPKQILIQAIAIAATITYTAIGTFIVVKIVSLLTGGIRVDEETEVMGLDLAVHSEKGFDL
ncbi:ammonia channel protein [Desulfurella acetivorans A63]|nr:ammonia channel protein [Desulfurella acetivorans A63]